MSTEKPLMFQAELDEHIQREAPTNGHFAIAYALLRVARELEMLGNGKSTSPEGFGALEKLGMHIGEKLDALAEAMREKEQ